LIVKAIVPEVYVSDCRTALDFYQEIFGGEIRNLQVSDNLEMFKKYENKIIHSELHVSSRCIFYFLDILDKKRENIGNVTLMLHLHTKTELERVYKGLSRGGKVSMEMQKTFNGQYHAILTDRFDVSWALNFSPKNIRAK